MIDRERVVKAEALLPEEHDDVAERAVADVEVARDTNCFSKALETAALTVFELLLDSVRNLLAILVLFLPGLNGEFGTIGTEPMLVELTVVVIDLVAHGVLKAETNDVTRHPRHHNVYVDMERVSVVRRLN